MARPKYMAYVGRGYDSKERFYNAEEGLKVKYTAWPWFFSNLEKDEAFIYGADNSIVACTYGANKLIDRQIIAAAPELLEACKVLLSEFLEAQEDNEDWVEGDEGSWTDAIKQTRQAIAKAEGRTA